MKKRITSIALCTAGSFLLLNTIRHAINYFSTRNHNLSSQNEQIYSWKLGDVCYTKQGNGSPLLLVHDLSPASSSFEWSTIVEQLAQEHTVYTLDLPGCGRSEKQGTAYTSYFYIQLLTDFTKEIIHQKTDVLAFGCSASVVLMLCKMDECIFHTIGLISPEDIEKHYQSIHFSDKCYRKLINTPLLGTLIYQYHTRKSKLKRNLTKNLNLESHQIEQELLPYYHEGAHLGKSMGKYLYSSLSSGYLHVNILDALKEVNHTIFILYGEDDAEMKEIVEKYLFFNPSIESISISSCKRYPQFEQPEKFLETLQIYL